MGATFEQLQSAQQLLKRWRQGEAQAPRSMAKNVAKNGTTPWKTMENHGKPWKNHGKPWKTMENHGKTMEMFIWKVYFHRNSFWGPRNQAGISTEKNFYFCGTRIWMILQEGMDNKQITERFMDGTIVWNDCFSGS
jgi:hypothetical protein